MARLLRATLLAGLLAVTGLAAANGSNILTCSTGVPPYLDCAYERVDWSLLGLEGGVGARLVIDQQNASLLNITPFVVFGYYADTYAVWLEVQAPEGVVPLVGDDPQLLNLGWEYRW